MAEQLDEIRARRDAAKRPWHFEERDDDIVVHLPLPDAEFIAHAPADVGWLLEHIGQLQNALAALVGLKDGPRDDTYRALKDAAWQHGRDVLAALGDADER